MLAMNFTPWNDQDTTFAKLFHLNEQRKKRSAEMAHWRTVHADILAILHETMPKPDNRKQFMASAQDAADQITKIIKTKQGIRNAEK